MRRRKHTLKTGNLLAHIDSGQLDAARGIYFLVEGTSGVVALQNLLALYKEEASKDPRLRWHTLASLSDLPEVEPLLDPKRVFCFEAGEFGNLDPADLRCLLIPALERLKRREDTIFPSAGGAVGGIARGIDFLDREESLADLKNRVRKGESILLKAPRRSGKSSILQRLAEDLAGDAGVVMVDASRDRSESGLAFRILAEIRKKPLGLLRREATDRRWNDVLLEGLKELGIRNKAVLIIDELGWFCEQVNDTKGVLAFLGLIANTCGELGIRVLLAGSQDLEELFTRVLGVHLRDLGGVFEKMAILPLPPLAEGKVAPECRRLLLGSGLVAEQGDIEWIEKNIDFLMPYPARRFLDLMGTKATEGRVLTTDDLDVIMAEFLESTDAFASIESHIEEIASSPPGNARTLYDVLTDLASRNDSDEGAMETELASRLGEGDMATGGDRLAELVNIIPVDRIDGKLMLVGKLFRRWWLWREGVER